MAVAATQRTHARAVSDRSEIAAFLRTDRRYAAYALGDLDGPNRGRVAWGMAYDGGGQPTALVMHHEGLVPQPLYWLFSVGAFGVTTAANYALSGLVDVGGYVKATGTSVQINLPKTALKGRRSEPT